MNKIIQLIKDRVQEKECQLIEMTWSERRDNTSEALSCAETLIELQNLLIEVMEAVGLDEQINCERSVSE